MKSGHYRKTELEIITVTDLDGELTVETTGKNILREKTFNSELGSLVSKIFNNEKMSEKPPDHFVDSDFVQENTLLLRCEKLIYQLKHSDDIDSISSSYNPFDADIDIYDDIDDTADYIKTGLLQCGYSRFQILKYNFNDKAYRSDINLLDSSYSSDMYFSIYDPLILRIQEHGEGYVLSPELINSNPFFLKKFLNNDADDLTPRAFFIIKISDLFNDSINLKTLKNNIIKFEEFLSPLLLVELKNHNDLKPAEISKRLKESAAIPLMLYFQNNQIRFSITDYSYEDTLLMIEQFLKSAVNSNLKSYIITLKDYSSKANIFILKFVLSQIRRIFKRHSLILKISINRAVLITPSTELNDLYNIIDRANSGVEIIDLQQINYNEYLNSKEFVNLFL